MRRYQAAAVPVGEHLADQLLLPLVLAKGGSFKTLKPSQHLLTNADVIRQLTGVDITLAQVGSDAWLVTAGSVSS